MHQAQINDMNLKQFKIFPMVLQCSTGFPLLLKQMSIAVYVCLIINVHSVTNDIGP